MQSVYPNSNENLSNHKWVSERAILAVTNEFVDEINFSNDNDTVIYPQEFLNSLQPCGMPQYILSLKIDVPIMLLCNLAPPKLCNGTRLIVKKLFNNSIEATIITGQFKEEIVLIPWIPIMSSDSVIEFKRLQFPIKIAFAKTINKSQEQSFNEIGIDLQQEVFTHELCGNIENYETKPFAYFNKRVRSSFRKWNYCKHSDQK